MSFDEMIRGLEENVALGYISSVEMPGGKGRVRLYNYTRRTTFERVWNKWTCKARGLIVDLDRKEIVACPFPKFFNYEELAKYIDPSIPVQADFHILPPGTTVTEKMDGSLGIIFYYPTETNGGWNVSTRGSFTSTQSVWALRWLKRENILNRLTPGITYLVEIIYPENRIVIDYDKESLVLLGAYRSNGEEIVNLKSLETGLEIVSNHDFRSAADLILECKRLPSSKEGYVVRLPNGMRCKFKGDAYVKIHKIRSGFGPSLVWSNLLCCVPNPKETLPEEFYDEYDQIELCIKTKLSLVLERIRGLFRQHQHRENKEIALDASLAEEDRMLIFMAKNPKWEASYATANHRIRRTIFSIAEKLP